MISLRQSISTAVLVSLLAAGCGSGGSSSSSESSTADWADGVCGALNTWEDSLTSVTDDLKAGNVSKSALDDDATKVKDATNTLVDDLKALGKPDTDAGKEAKSTVDQLSTQISSSVDKIESTTKDVSDVSGAMSAVSVVSATLVTMGNDVSTAVTSLKSLPGEGKSSLENAFNDSSACKQLQSGG